MNSSNGSYYPSDIFRIIGVIVCILSVIGGVILGVAVSAAAMLYAWLGTFFLALIFYAVSKHLDNQETIIALLRKMYIAMPDRPADSGT